MAHILWVLYNTETKQWTLTPVSMKAGKSPMSGWVSHLDKPLGKELHEFLCVEYRDFCLCGKEDLLDYGGKTSKYRSWVATDDDSKVFPAQLVARYNPDLNQNFSVYLNELKSEYYNEVWHCGRLFLPLHCSAAVEGYKNDLGRFMVMGAVAKVSIITCIY
jgi:hypothetical protein